MENFTEQKNTLGLYDPQFEHDACGIGAVVNISGQRTHETLDGALKIVEKLAHRTGKDADGTTGDGVGIMTQLPYAFFEKTARQAGKPLPEAGDYGVAMIFFPQDPLKREFYLPVAVNAQLQAGTARVRVLPCEEVWHGVTYREDLASVKDAIRALKAAGVYEERLWPDTKD